MTIKVLRIEAVLKQHGCTKHHHETDEVAITEDCDVDELVQMMYGCYYDVITYVAEYRYIDMTSTLMEQIAIEVVKEKFKL